ncbi:MAG: GAF domain-containing protein [Burkholderiales bacterium]
MELRTRLRRAEQRLRQVEARYALATRRARDGATEALEQQTATAAILKATLDSPNDVQQVFQAILTNASRLCEASFAAVFLYDGEVLRNVAHQNASAEFAQALQGMRAGPSRETTTRRSALERRTIHTADLLNDPEFSPPAAQRRENVRTALSVPMMREGILFGVITLWRDEVRPFTDRQIALVQTFADQAVITIENVRLFNETKEALEQQIATAEILRVISRSPTDVQPVFEAIVRSGIRLFEGAGVTVTRPENGQVHLMAIAERDPERARSWTERFPFPLTREYMHGAAILDCRMVDMPDVELMDERFAAGKRNFAASGYRAMTVVPMVKDGAAIGTIAVVRDAAGPLSDKQIALLKTFADQAVIAIENVRLFNKTSEALEEQIATAETLRVVAQLQSDVQPVLDAIARNAAQLCGALFSCVYRFDGELVHLVATHNLAPGAMELGRTMYPMRPDRSQLSGRAVLTRAVQRLEDVAQDSDYAMRVATEGGWRRLLAVPMLREAKPLGVIVVGWRGPGPIPERQVELLKTFADQAVIAIENVRLFNETKEALEQQTATAEILRVISGSITDTQPVFDAIVRNCQRLFGGRAVALVMPNGATLRSVAFASDGSVKGEEAPMNPWPLDRASAGGACILDSRVIAVPDIAEAVPTYPRMAQLALDLGYRSALVVPLMREGKAIACLAMLRAQSGEFSDKEISLASTFADQAVIAIENVRLFNETKEALEQQTATAEVLRVMSESQTDVQPVFDAIVRSAVRLCEGVHGSLFRFDGGLQHFVAHHGVDARTVEELLRRYPRPPQPDTVTGRAILERSVIHVGDVLADARFPDSQMIIKRAGNRAVLAVPMLKEDAPVGVIFVVRKEARRYSDKQIALLKTFADQAVIAIENVRLFNETKESLEQQKASAEVLGAISSSIADTAPVFDKILESCERLFAGRIVGLNLVGEDGLLHIGAYHGYDREEFERIFPLPVSPESGSGLSIVERRVVHYPDTEHGEGVPAKTKQGCKAIGIKSAIFAPMLWEGRGMGAIFVGRDHVSSFSEKEIALLRTFADQAAIAIENVRLFNEIQEKSRQLEVASRHKSEFLANMSHELRTPLNAIIGFTRIMMRRSKEHLEPKQYENLEKILTSGEHLLALINAILDLSKVEAGHIEVNASEIRLAPVLEQCVRTVEPLVKTDAVRLVKELNGELPELYLDEEKLRQIVINLLSNAVKFTSSGSIRLQAQAANGSVAIAVADTGIGIPADKLGLIFEEFEQADASSTRVHGGTGLGLAIARRLARLMGGDIAVESAIGSGSTFTLTLPVRYQARA